MSCDYAMLPEELHFGMTDVTTRLKNIIEHDRRMIDAAKTPQPPPTGNGKEVLPHVVRDLTARVEWGKEKYGTVLKTLNGRAALIDAYQEALDLVMYLKQELLEKEGDGMRKFINEWATEVHALAIEKGWYDGDEREVPELLCLIHSEISEALEAYREGNDDGFAEELADVAIRLFDMCEYLDIDLNQGVEKKHGKNINRPYRHGNKRC